MTVREHAQGLLRELTDDAHAVFRTGQWEAIEALVVQRATVLVVQRTGWGKSGVYFIATRLLRDQGAGPTLLVSPLLALMRDQVRAAERLGIHAATINSENRDDWDDVEARARAGAVDLLLVSPERLNNVRFRQEVLPQLTGSVGLLVVDEAHCISDWGHDFRPDYRRISRVLPMLPRGVPVLCTTATANDRVIADIVEQTGGGLVVLRGSLDRESLHLSVLRMPARAQRLAWLAQAIPMLPGSGIVYCLTVEDTRRVAGWLATRGIDAVAYSGETDADQRLEIERRLVANDVKVVVATSALGMGFDKPDLAFVIHYQSPGSAIAYYQQVGRAGRALDTAVGMLLCGSEDEEIQDYFIGTAFPAREHADRVVALLEGRDQPTKLTEIEAAVNVRRSRLEAMLKILEVEGAVERVDGGWVRTVRAWAYPTERVEAITALRRSEQAAMREYGTTATCRMAFLRAQLDDPSHEPCGRCDNCTGERWTVDLDPRVLADARSYLRNSHVLIEPRQRWPSGFTTRRGFIPESLRLMPGRALSSYDDGGWGSEVRRAKYDAGSVSDEMLRAAVELIRRWAPDPPPRWVTAVPSTSSGLVADLAVRMGAALRIPFHDVVRRVRATRPQKEMENSVQQVANVFGAFAVVGEVPPEPVLLVDDIFDSRWTLTVVGMVLREAGAGPVFPFALARAVST